MTRALAGTCLICSFDGANLAGADLRGASGITAQQVCSASHGRAAMMDPDLAAEVQLRCGSAQ